MPPIAELNGRPVVVLTHDGTPVSIGRIRVTSVAPGDLQRVEVVFETEMLQCAIAVPPRQLPALQATYKDATYTYRLPEGDKLWRSEPGPLPQENSGATAKEEFQTPVIEAFPLPPSARMTGVGEKKKPGDAIIRLTRSR